MENQSIEIELIPVKVHLSNQLMVDNIRETINECDLHIHNGSYGAAITMAKTLLEGVFKEIIRTESPGLLEVHQDFPVLKKKAFEIIELTTNNEAYQKDIKKLVGNISTIADTVNSIRNKVGIGHEAIDKPTISHALLVVNAAKTVTTFVLQIFDERNKRVRELINE
ncbi:abortive infection family protein [Lysinibacillus fusiformis]|uniref:abortive infection family protein n=1 Tax=Lysinibacillus fusiformis TaxID=28031 RepID=UPI00263A8F93|nr:abortive infection family protein [Lysinibacillus fusiformis]MDC6269269.1 abortive infection family protein [Lysinibacillus sphaericus]MDN4970956.1 abortive infection family protein [Lysinibacillus fusiformis]